MFGGTEITGLILPSIKQHRGFFMKTVKYLFLCVMNTLSFNVLYTKDMIFGVLQILLYFAVLFVSSGLLVFYCNVSEILAGLYGFLITIGFVLVLYGTIFLIECAIRLIVRLKK